MRKIKHAFAQLIINSLASASLTYLFVLTDTFTPFWYTLFFIGSFIIFTGMGIAKEEHIKEVKREQERKALREQQEREALHRARLEASQNVIYIAKGQNTSSTQDFKTPAFYKRVK